jgi:hypothetical protein
MNKAEWETKHHYMKSEHNCGFCKHCSSNIIDPWTERLYCEKKREAGTSVATRSSYECDLWEHR